MNKNTITAIIAGAMITGSTVALAANKRSVRTELPDNAGDCG